MEVLEPWTFLLPPTAGIISREEHHQILDAGEIRDAVIPMNSFDVVTGPTQ